MRYLSACFSILCVIVCAPTTSAGPIADSIAFQGQLTDALSNPVPDGPKDLILSVWTDSVGGTMLHSEIVVVTTSRGLFATCLGCGSSSLPDIFTGQTLFLQTQLAGQPPMEPRTRMRAVAQAMTASSLHSETSFASQRAKGTVKGGGGGLDATMALLFEADADDDGIEDYVITDSVSATGAKRMTAHDLDDDGTPDVVVAESANPTGALGHFGHSQGSNVGLGSMRINSDSSEILISQSDQTAAATVRTRASNHRKSISVRLHSHQATSSRSARLFSEADSSGMVLDCDDDGDGSPEQEISSAIVPTMSQFAVNTKGTGAQSGRVVSVTSGTTVDSAKQVISIDDDGDGVAETSDSTIVSEGSAERKIRVTNLGSSGQDGVEVQLKLTPRKGDVKITASQNSQSLRCSSSADSVSATTLLEADSDGDGVPEGEISSIVLPTTCSVAINSKGTGADRNRVITTTTPDSVVTEHTFEFTNSLLMPARMKAKEKANRTKCGNNIRYSDTNTTIETENSCDSTTARMTFSTSNAMGTGNSLIIQLDLAGTANPIEHSSGAHLTAGGVWTNASDQNLKENFQPVDGAELLEKIEQLPISEWNYKVETDEIRHIGPTAQDFQATFGVGSDGKSISTIDPSGIALAAIKELNTKLERENQALRKEMDELKKLVQQLASKR